MVEDTPQDLVHDLLAEAIFGRHALGRPVIGRAGVISSVSRAYARRRTTARRTAPATSSSRRPATSSTTTCCRCSSAPPASASSRRRRGASRPQAAREAAAAGPALPAQGHGAVPRVRRRAPGSRAPTAGGSPPRVLDAILGGSASSRLFQEIREKRGMAYAVYTFAGQYSDTGQIGVYIGTREENLEPCLAIVAEQIARRRRGQRERGRAGAGEGEPQGPHRAGDGVDLEPHEPARQGADHRHRAPVARPRDRGGRRRRASRASPSSPAVLLAPEQLSAAGIGPSEERFRAAVERVHPGLPDAGCRLGDRHPDPRRQLWRGRSGCHRRRSCGMTRPRDRVNAGHGPVTRIRHPHRAVT